MENAMRIFDADSHMIEPPLLWLERLDQKTRNRAPRVVKDPDGKKGTFFLCEDSPPLRMAPLYAAGQTLDKSFLDAGLDSCPAGGWEPDARLKDMQSDGVAGQVLYTSVGFSLFGIKDADLQEACFTVYNDWLAEFCMAAPDKFAGLALISLYDVGRAVKELERCRKLGLHGAMIWSEAPESQPYRRASTIRSGRQRRNWGCPWPCMRRRDSAARAASGWTPIRSTASSTLCRSCMRSSEPS